MGFALYCFGRSVFFFFFCFVLGGFVKGKERKKELGRPFETL